MDHTQAARVVKVGCLYVRQSLQEALQISPHTFDAWKASGLKTYSPGTKAEFVFGDELIEFIRSGAFASDKKYVNPNAAKNAARKKKPGK